MIPKRELTQEQTEEIQALRGRLSADEVKKHFGIGSSRLYRIWGEDTADSITQKALPPRPPAQTANHITQEALPPTDLPPPAHHGVLPHGETLTIEDFYKRLEGLETRAEQSTRLLMEVMAQLVHNNKLEEERYKLEEEREEERSELEEKREEETWMDIQKWTYLSIAAILLWKIVGATWKQCAPAVQEQIATPAVQEQTAATWSRAFGRKQLLQNRHGNRLQKRRSAALPVQVVLGTSKGLRQRTQEVRLGVV